MIILVCISKKVVHMKKKKKKNNDVTKLKVLDPDSESMTLAYEMICLCPQTGL